MHMAQHTHSPQHNDIKHLCLTLCTTTCSETKCIVPAFPRFFFLNKEILICIRGVSLKRKHSSALDDYVMKEPTVKLKLDIRHPKVQLAQRVFPTEKEVLRKQALCDTFSSFVARMEKRLEAQQTASIILLLHCKRHQAVASLSTWTSF